MNNQGRKNTAEKFRRRAAIPRTTYKNIEQDPLHQSMENWETCMIAGRKVGEQKEINVLACLLVIAVCSSVDGIEDAEYIPQQTVREYLKYFCKDIFDMYGEMYL